MTRSLLHITQRDTSVEGGGDERMPQAVRRDPLGDPGPLRQAFHRPVSGVAVHSLAVGTVVCAIIDDLQRQVTWCRAGHPPPLLASASASQWLDGGVGPPLTVPTQQRRHDERAPIDAGQVLVVYTDGLVERRNEVIDTGLDRLASTVRALIDHPAPVIADDTLSALVPTGARDDVVIVVAHTNPSTDNQPDRTPVPVSTALGCS